MAEGLGNCKAFVDVEGGTTLVSFDSVSTEDVISIDIYFCIEVTTLEVCLSQGEEGNYPL